LWTSAAQAISMYIVGAYGKTEPPIPGAPVSLSPHVSSKTDWGCGVVANHTCFRSLASDTSPSS
jgi:hypothetical protein